VTVFSVTTLEGLEALIVDAEVQRSAEARWQAVAAVDPGLVGELLHGGFSLAEDSAGTAVATGIAASPGAASGVVCLTSDRVMDVVDAGGQALLVCLETSPADELGMQLAEGILTARGGMACHAAVVARGWGIPAVVGMNDLEIGGDHIVLGGVRIDEGAEVSLDGFTGQVFVGGAEVSEVAEAPALITLLSWADEVRGERVGVLANADTGEDARRAVDHGAEGIGLCRTEHMFFGDRLSLIQKFLRAESPDDESKALAALEKAQHEDFVPVLEAMGELPVTVRLLDAPLHEFLGAGSGARDAGGHEHNPMLGMRGVRLAVLRQGLYRMQARALLGAIAEVTAAGGHPHVSIMIPLVSDRAELILVRDWIREEINTALEQYEIAHSPAVGTMIETPRAALSAAEIAREADFFSFGTNDLTQLVFGFSRDDVEVQMMGQYLEMGLLENNPFEVLDPGTVGPLIAAATRAARLAKPEIPVGICGEHGGDPASIAQLVAAGVDYVSCSPFRVPVARLAVAQALIQQDS